MDLPITALQTLDCDWSVDKFIEVNFSKLTDNNQIITNHFDCIHYHLCKYLKLLSAKFLLPMISLKWTLYNYTYSMVTPRLVQGYPLWETAVRNTWTVDAWHSTKTALQVNQTRREKSPAQCKYCPLPNTAGVEHQLNASTAHSPTLQG